MTRRRSLAGLALVLCCASLAPGPLGCAGPAPERTRYLLRAPEKDGLVVLDAARVALRRVEVAPYLEEPGLVLETAPGRVRTARFHEWAEPLKEAVRSVLQVELARSLGGPEGAPRRVVDLRIDQLHGTSDGRALLVATWAVSDPRAAPAAGEERAYRLVRSAPLDDGSYVALVQAERRLLGALAQEIAGSIAAPR